MKTLWKMRLYRDHEVFESAEMSPDKQKDRSISVYSFQGKTIHSIQEPEIKQLINAAQKMCGIINLEPSKAVGIPVSIFCGLDVITVSCESFLFEIRSVNGMPKVKTVNSCMYTREQFNAIFDFIDVLIENGWFF